MNSLASSPSPPFFQAAVVSVNAGDCGSYGGSAALSSHCQKQKTLCCLSFDDGSGYGYTVATVVIVIAVTVAGGCVMLVMLVIVVGSGNDSNSMIDGGWNGREWQGWQ